MSRDDDLALMTLPDDPGRVIVSGAQHDLFLKVLAETGSARRAAEAARPDLDANKAMTYFRNLALRDKGFAERQRAALEATLAIVETVIYDHAINGWEEPVFQGGEQVGTVTKFDHKLMVTVAKRTARKLGDDSWEDQKTVKHEGGQEIKHTIDFRDLPPDDRRKILAERRRIIDSQAIPATSVEKKTP